MTPVVFGGCFGWLHPASGPAATGRGVVLCSPYGYEAICAHRGLRQLAGELAAAGMPVLRFDYPGTGDSAGDEAPDRLPDWLDGIEAAADRLRRETGITEVALCGLRLGATLAAAAAARHPGRFAALALLAPVLSGKAYLRQLTLAARTGRGAGAPEPDWLEAAGFRLHRSDAEALARLDLADLLEAARVPQVLALHPARQPRPGPALAARLREAGTALTEAPFEGYDAFLRDAYLSQVPRADFARTAGWLRQGAPPARAARGMAATPGVLALPDGVRERAILFGPERGLAGVLCEPARAGAGLPAVLLLNTGANHHIGNGRMAVRLARRLARLGVTSFRVDAAGVGDSEAPPGAADPDGPPSLYDEDATAHVPAALDLLEARGFPHCFVIGICSGAHVAFQAALRDWRITGLALANLPAFDRDAGGAPALDGGPPPGEIHALRRLRMLARRLLAEADRLLAEGLGLELGLNRAAGWVRGLARRGVSMLLVYSAGDRGLRELRAHFGRGGRTLSRLPGLRRVVLSCSDHALNPRAMQQEFQALVEEHLRRHHGLGGPARRLEPDPMPPLAAWATAPGEPALLRRAVLPLLPAWLHRGHGVGRRSQSRNFKAG